MVSLAISNVYLLSNPILPPKQSAKVSSSITSNTALAAAAQTGFAPYVENINFSV